MKTKLSSPKLRVPYSLAENKRLVEEWNKAHRQLGVPVRVLKDDGSTVETTTTSSACLMGGHTAVIFLHGFKGCYSLARVTAL